MPSDPRGEGDGAGTSPTTALYAVVAATATVPAAVALTLSALGVGGGLAWLVAAASGLGLAALWFVKVDRDLTAWPAGLVCGLVVPLLVLGFAVDSLVLLTGSYPVVTLRELRRTEEDVVAVADGVVHPELQGKHVVEPEGARSYLPTSHYIAPLVPEDWSPDAPVEVWVNCEGEGDDPRASCVPVFERRPLVGMVSREVAVDNAALSDAMREHGLAATPRVVVLRTSTRPGLDAWAGLVGVTGLVLVVNAVLLVLAASRRRGRPPVRL